MYDCLFMSLNVILLILRKSCYLLISMDFQESMQYRLSCLEGN